METIAFAAGVEAAHDGKRVSANPYEIGTVESADWLDGHEAGCEGMDADEDERRFGPGYPGEF
jgi:hypothetical protein